MLQLQLNLCQPGRHRHTESTFLHSPDYTAERFLLFCPLTGRNREISPQQRLQWCNVTWAELCTGSQVPCWLSHQLAATNYSCKIHLLDFVHEQLMLTYNAAVWLVLHSCFWILLNKCFKFIIHCWVQAVSPPKKQHGKERGAFLSFCVISRSFGKCTSSFHFRNLVILQWHKHITHKHFVFLDNIFRHETPVKFPQCMVQPI